MDDGYDHHLTLLLYYLLILTSKLATALIHEITGNFVRFIRPTTESANATRESLLVVIMVQMRINTRHDAIAKYLTLVRFERDNDGRTDHPTI